MGKTVLDLTPEEKKSFRPLDVVKQRQEAPDPEIEARWHQAQRLAGQAAQLLHEEFDAKRVLLFGSTAHRSWFSYWSDVDLAAWGVAPERFYAAVAAVTSLSTDINVDLIDPDQFTAEFKAEIERYGTEM